MQKERRVFYVECGAVRGKVEVERQCCSILFLSLDMCDWERLRIDLCLGFRLCWDFGLQGCCVIVDGFVGKFVFVAACGFLFCSACVGAGGRDKNV